MESFEASVDLTDWRRLEEALRVSEAHFRSAFQEAAIGMSLVDPSGQLLQVNPALCTLLGYSEAELLALDFQSLTHPDDLVASQTHVRQLLDGATAAGMLEKRYLHRDGHAIWVQLSASVQRDEAGRPLYFINQLQDVTARKATEAALRESEQRYRQVEEQAPIGLALVALDGRWLRVNPALCALVGYTEAELLARSFQDITHPDDLDSDLDYVRQVLAGEIATYQLEKRYLRKDGTQVCVLLSVSLVRDEAWQPHYFISQIQDISERKEVERALERSRAVAEELAHLRQEQAEEAEAMARVSSALSSSLEPSQLYQRILEQAVSVLPCDNACVFLVQDGWAVVAAGWGEPMLPLGARAFPASVWGPDFSLNRGDPPLYHPDMRLVRDHTPPEPWVGVHEVRSIITVPLAIDGVQVGAFDVASTKPNFYTERHVRMAAMFGDRINQALRNVRQYATEHAARAQAEQSETNLRSIIRASPMPMVTFDRMGIVQSWNAAAERAFGWRSEEVIGQDAPMVPEETRHGIVELSEQILAGEGLSDLEVSAHKKDGSPVDLLLSAAPLRDAAGMLIGIVAVYVDITARKHGEEALRHQALHDSLTGLPNRVLLGEILSGTLRMAQDTGQSLSLLLLDLDRFKEVNDTLGHHVGDVLLRQVGVRLQQAIGATETIARLGGDEFAIVLPAANAGEALTVGRLVLQSLATPFQIGQHLLDLGGSVGVAVYPEHGTEAQTLLQHADVAMYVAKRAQSGVEIYEPVLDQYTVRRLALMHDLRRAILDGGLYLYYQPKVSLATKQVCGVEALLRWSHPVHGFIPPDEFIPLAEQTGMIVSLTEWVLLTALAQAKDWREAGRPIPVAINLSARSLQDQQFPDLVARHLRRYGLAPADLTLEITESSLMTDPARAREVLIQLHTLGVRMAIDDFGTGYSSLGYLKDLPVDELKIDKSFVLGMGTGDHKDAAIVRSVVVMAHALDLAVVAEGVEDLATYMLLGSLGCDIAQGYYLSRPQPAAALDQWLLTYPPEAS